MKVKEIPVDVMHYRMDLLEKRVEAIEKMQQDMFQKLLEYLKPTPVISQAPPPIDEPVADSKIKGKGVNRRLLTII